MISHANAKQLAVQVGNKLLPFCDRLNIAGSIRRGKAEVHDIEIVCQPKRIKVGMVDLFGEDTRKEEVNADFVKVVLNLGKVIKGKPDGRMMQIEIKSPYEGPNTIMLDLFMPQAHDYMRQYAIRTGSADYSHKVIAAGWLKLGWVGTSDGLRLESECIGNKGPDGKVKWTCVAKEPKLPPYWQTEKEFFEWLGVQYLPPAIRFITV